MASTLGAPPPAGPPKRTSYTTREWIVPERPKPGRKPKAKRPVAPPPPPPPRSTQAQLVSPSDPASGGQPVPGASSGVKTAVNAGDMVRSTSSSSSPLPLGGPSPPSLPDPVHSRPPGGGGGSKAQALREKDSKLSSLSSRILQLEAQQGEKAVFFQGQAVQWKEESDRLKAIVEGLRRDARDAKTREDDLRSQLQGLQRRLGPDQMHRTDQRDPDGSRLQRENAILKSHAETLRNEVERLRRIITSLKHDRHPTTRRSRSPSFVNPQPHQGTGTFDPRTSGSAKRRRTGSGSPVPVPVPARGLSTSDMLLAAAGMSLGIPLPLPSPRDEMDVEPDLEDGVPGGRCGLCEPDGTGYCPCREVGILPSSSSSTNATGTDRVPGDSVPLRFARPSNSTKRAPIWPTTPISSTPTLSLDSPTTGRLGGLLQRRMSYGNGASVLKESRVREEDAAGADCEAADCSGDPANCPACKDDPFGRAFCSALSANVCSSNPCADCPNASTATSTISAGSVTTAAAAPSQPTFSGAGAKEEEVEEEEIDPVDQFTAIPCCGHPELCGSQTCLPASTASEPAAPSPATTKTEMGNGGAEDDGSMPCSDAWRQLKAHPNIGYANLQLLADVVSRRTRCDGPASTAAHQGGTPPRPSPLRQEITFRPGHARLSADHEGPGGAVVKMEEIEQTSSTALWSAASPSSTREPSSQPLPPRLPTPPERSIDGLVPHETLLAAYEGAHQQQHRAEDRLSNKGDGVTTAGRRLTVERQAVREALQMLDRAMGKGFS